MPSARSQRRVSRAISLTTPTPSSIGFEATCRWIASASLPSTWPSAHAESTISSTTRLAWAGSDRCTPALCPRSGLRVHRPRRAGLRGLPALDMALHEIWNDDEGEDERDADYDLEPANLVRQLVGSAERVAQRDDDGHLDDRHRGVEREELPRRQLRRADRKVHRSAQGDEETPEKDRPQLVPLDQVLRPLSHRRLDDLLPDSRAQELGQETAAERERRGVADQHGGERT